MPIREYIRRDGEPGCDYCSKVFEQLEHPSCPVLEKCPRCRSQVHRVYSAPRVMNGTHLDDRARKAGFHKLKKISSGEYEKMY